TPAEQLEFEPYKKYDINVGIRNKMEYHLEVGPPYTYDNYLRGYIAPKLVRSYKTDGSTIYPASWWVEGYSESGENGPFTSTKPAWLNDFTQHGNGVNNPTAYENIIINVSDQTPTITSNARTTALRGKSEVGTNSAPIDLSKVPVGTSPFFSIQDGATASTFNSNPMNTANCYVVTRPGWYKIPVVYGNAYKNGAPNTSAYTSSESGEHVLNPFIRHDENSITAPWIKDNINLDSGVAELVWQDQPNLVQNIQLQSDKKYIVFYVSQATIHEGNAVITLKESASGDIVWSWHIWVYGGDDLKTINVKNNKGKSGGRPGQDNFDFLSENLGSCYDGDITSYPESKVWVKISNGRKTEVIKITRLGRVLLASYYNVSYYQWGRKDPMLSGRVGSIYNSKVWYDNSGVSNSNFPIYTWSSSGSVVQAKNEIANTIKHPNAFNRYQGMDYRYYNLWDTKCNETGGYRNITAAIFEAATKSVYDPCPPGFCLPPNGAFTGFTRSGNLASQSSEFNIAYYVFHEGYYFHTVLIEMQSWGSSYESIFFPVSGYRHYNGMGVGFCTNMKMDGYYWSSSSYNMHKGDYLLFFDGNVRPLEVNDRSFGYAVRPVAEN
ncbi:MAG: hypothetical protein ACTTK1_07140, partial [Candidatus Cryptobacteroides sp.]